MLARLSTGGTLPTVPLPQLNRQTLGSAQSYDHTGEVMLDEFRKSIQLILHERITSPLSGAVILSWLVWNWRIPYFLLFSDSSLTLSGRITHVEAHFLNYSENVILPLVSALFLVLVYPFATTGALSVWLRFRKWQNSIRNQIDGSQLLTLEQSVQIKLQMRRQLSDLADLIRARDEEIEALRAEKKELQERLNPTPSPETEEAPTVELSDLAKKILIEASQDERGGVHVISHTGGLFAQTHNVTFGEKATAREQADIKAAIRELQSLDLLDMKSESYYELTNLGYQIGDKLKGAA